MIRRSEHLLRSTRFVVFANWPKESHAHAPWTLDLGPWLCRSPSVQLAEVQDNFLSSEECEFLKAQVHFDVRGSGGSLKGVKDPKDL